MAPTIKSAVSVPPSTSSSRPSVDWGDWGSHDDAGAVSAAKSTTTSSPGSAPSATPRKEPGYSKEDGFDKFIRVMDRVETFIERVTGTSRDERITRNADNAWKGPFRF
jgi:hypothetical protein